MIIGSQHIVCPGVDAAIKMYEHYRVLSVNLNVPIGLPYSGTFTSVPYSQITAFMFEDMDTFVINGHEIQDRLVDIFSLNTAFVAGMQTAFRPPRYPDDRLLIRDEGSFFCHANIITQSFV